MKLTTLTCGLAVPGKMTSYTAVLLLLLIAGCARLTSDTPVSQPEAIAPQPAPAAAPEPGVTTPAPQAASKAAPRVAKTPASAAQALKPGAPPASPATVVTPTLDLIALKERLKGTKAIGIFTKITLKNKVDDLLGQFREYYHDKAKAKVTMTELRRSYDLLLMKVLSLLQDSDQNLASAIVSSREAIWAMLADPKKFATLQS